MAVAPILIRTLRWGGLFVVAVALVAGGVGWLTAGTSGLLAGLDRAGVPIVVSDEQADVLLPGRATAGADGAARDLLVVAGDDAIAAMAARPGMVQVAAMTPSAAEADAGVPSIGVFTAG